MAGEGAAAAIVPARAAAPKKSLKEESDDEFDNVPLSVSRGKKASNASASKVKKGEEEDDDNVPISQSRAKKGNEKQKSTVNSNAKASKVKKEENYSDDDFKPLAQKKSGGATASAKTSKVKKMKDEDFDDVKFVHLVKDEKKRKRTSVKNEKIGTGKKDKEKVKKERKVYELPGQKHDPPDERDSLRIFYESLYEQIPTSDMAATWLMEWGLLPLDVAKKVFEKKQGQKQLKSPVKTTSVKRIPASPAKKITPSSTKKTASAANNAGKTTSQKKRKPNSDSDDEDDDDFMAPRAKTKRQKASS
ncbi:hypothetical protein EJB05_07340 [Eragrostis curvula]|uniref:Uncharacterized protein n=1 Tax=Eragrostis curvula TaxID=38414 RepID=A0A5J9WI47_9POAL|nr:hypothetical protein EJB05_33607 [Eragrostis curvula]TVU47731.1 hypothetical protein EJB05_07340 [Eragrostis curvula]